MQEVPKSAQIVVFSATFDSEALELADKLTRADRVRLVVKPEQLTLAGLLQFYVAVGDDRFKADTLLDIYAEISTSQSLIFCATRARVDALCDALRKHDFTPVAIHSDLTQDERSSIIDAFRAARARVLVTTDLCARGLDVTGVGLVVNYDLPNDAATYLHRIGRAGRYGKKGLAITLVGDRDVQQLRRIEQYYATNIEELPADFMSRLS